MDKELQASNELVRKPVGPADRVGRLKNRKIIERYEQALKAAFNSERGEMDEINSNGLTEYFVGGAYVRSLFIPAGVTIVSELWKKERLWVIISGEVSIISELGLRRIRAPFIEVAPFGSKVALYAHVDTLWLAVTGAESTNSEDVKEEMIAKDYSDIPYPWDSSNLLEGDSK